MDADRGVRRSAASVAEAGLGMGVLGMAGSSSESRVATDENGAISGVLASEGTGDVVMWLKNRELKPVNDRASRGCGQGAKSRLR